MPAKTSRVVRPVFCLERSCRPASGWMGERALDSHCGENDRGEELVTMTRPYARGADAPGGQADVPLGEFLQTRTRLAHRKGSGFPLR